MAKSTDVVSTCMTTIFLKVILLMMCLKEGLAKFMMMETFLTLFGKLAAALAIQMIIINQEPSLKATTKMIIGRVLVVTNGQMEANGRVSSLVDT